VVIGLLVLVSGRLAGLSLDAGYVARRCSGSCRWSWSRPVWCFCWPAGRRRGSTRLWWWAGGLSFFASLLYTVLNLPAWLADLSMFYHMAADHRWATLGLLAGHDGLAVAVLALGVVGFTRADVQRGQ